MEEFVKEYSVWAMMLVMIVEYLLGKTSVVKANSIVESILNVLVSVLKLVFKGEEKPKE